MLPEGQKVLVAGKGLGEVQRLLGEEEIEVVLAEREVVFRVGRTSVTTRLIEGDFPNYEQLIPGGYPNKLTVARDQLSAAINRVRLVGQGRDTAPIRLAMTAEGLELSAVAQDVGEAHEMVEAKYEGSDLTVAFNSQFLLEGIDAASGSARGLPLLPNRRPRSLVGRDRRVRSQRRGQDQPARGAQLGGDDTLVSWCSGCCARAFGHRSRVRPRDRARAGP